LDRTRIEKQLESAKSKLKNYEASAGLSDFDVDDLWESLEKELQALVSENLAKGNHHYLIKFLFYF